MSLSTRRAFLQSLCVGGLAYQNSSDLAALGAPAKAGVRRGFTVFNSLLYKPMPDLRELGLPKLLPMDNTWRPGVSHDDVDPIGIANALRFVQRFTRDCYFDLEEWTVYGEQPDLEARIAKHVRTAEIAREVAPEMRFGFYGVVPTAPYWPILLNESSKLATWHTVSRLSRAIASKVDYLFPSLYTFYDDPKGWEITSREVLKEARQYGKPVYPFIWPGFHDSNPKLKLQPVPREFWRRQLEVCRECADGLVLWGGFTVWDEEAPWWLETKSFLSTLPHQPYAPTV